MKVKNIFVIVEVQTEEGKVYSDSVAWAGESQEKLLTRSKAIMDYLIHKHNLESKLELK